MYFEKSNLLSFTFIKFNSSLYFEEFSKLKNSEYTSVAIKNKCKN